MGDKIMKDLLEGGLVRLLRQDPIAAEEEFNRLPIVDQARLFLVSGDEDRLRLIDMSHSPRELLGQIPATEIWFTIRRMTPHDSISLIKYSPPEKLQVICDIEWWRKDNLDSGAIYEWLEYISACGMDKMVEWFKTGDWDQILWFFKQNIVVYKKEDKEEDPAGAISWPREASPITHEGVYYFQVLNEDREQLLCYFLEILVKHEQELYRGLCEACIWDVPSEREEDAYEVKSRRLAEEGFPTFDEAIAVYSPLDEKMFRSVAKKRIRGELMITPRYPLTVVGDKTLFLGKVLSKVSAEVEDFFLVETSALANKLIIADGLDIDPASMVEAVQKVMGYVNIGLETLSHGKLETAVSLIEEYWLVQIFQVGLSEVVKLTGYVGRVFKKGWMRGNKKNILLLEPEQQVLINNLLLKRPKYFVGGDEFVVGGIRDFMGSDEISLARQKVAEIEFVGRMVKNLFIRDIDPVFELNSNMEDIRFTGVIITALTNGALDGGWVFRPVPSGRFQKFLDALRLSEGDEILEGVFEKMRKWIVSTQGDLSKEEDAALDKFIKTAKLRLLEEFRDVSKVPEARFVNSAWVV